MARTGVMHIGTQSPKHGAIEALCGRLFHGTEREWFPRLPGYTKCPQCKALYDKGVRP